jgi:hypothetical protein
MKKYSLMAGLLGAMSLTLTSCEIIGDIFQAGMFVGIFVVVAVIALIIWLVRKTRG